MKRFDFTQTGGFPLTQDRLAWMQDGYINAINALGGIPGGTNPVVLSGVALTSGNWGNSGTVSDGWIWHPTLGLMPFVGGNFTASTNGVSYADLLTPLTFQNASQQNVQIKRVAQIAAGATYQLYNLSKNRWAAQLGIANRTDWQSATLLNQATGELKVLHDAISDVVHVRGHLSNTIQSVSLVNSGFPWQQAAQVSFFGNTVNSPIYFGTTINPVKDAANVWHITGNGKIDISFVASSQFSASAQLTFSLQQIQPAPGLNSSNLITHYFNFSFKV